MEGRFFLTIHLPSRKPFSYDFNFRGPFHIIDEQTGTSRRAANACSSIFYFIHGVLD
jgi:hypothetical protein